MTVPRDIVIKQKYLDALILFQQKIKEIEESKFFNFYFMGSKNVQLRITTKKADDGWIGSCSLNEPNEESIKAFILPFRFFILGNESCSIRQIGDKVLPNIEQNFSTHVNKIVKLREFINKYLDSSPDFRYQFNFGKKKIEFSSNREINDIFIFGHYAHASSKYEKKKIYDFIHLNADEGLNAIKRNTFRFSAINIILTLTNLFRNISFEIGMILNKVINIYINQAEQALKHNVLKKSVDLFKNALYIANALENKDIRADLYLKLKEVYDKSNSEEIAKVFQGKYEEVKDSVNYLPKEFWTDDYYRNKYSLPDEYKKLLDEILENPEDYSDKPIIILPIEKIYQLKQFEKIIIAKNFNVNQEEEKITLFYEQIISKDHEKSYWAHQRFEFNKNAEFICRFPFIDDSGVVFLTNSKILFAKMFLSWLTIREIIQNSGINYIFLQHYVDYLVDIGLEKEINLEVFNRMRTMKDSESLAYSIKGPEKINQHLYELKNILEPIFEIATFPRLKLIINLDSDMDYINAHIIEPFLKQEFKGLKWVSSALKIILFIFITGNEQISKRINDTNFTKLHIICKKIEGKSVSNEFFKELFKFFDKYIQKYISNRGESRFKIAWYNKGASSYMLEQYNEAIEYFDKALAIDPNNKNSWFYKGISFFKIDKFEASIQSYQKVLEIDPNNKEVWFYKGMSFFRLEKYKKSIECYNNALKDKFEDSQTWFYKGVSYHLLKEYEMALNCFDKVIEYDPESIDAWNKKSVVYYDLDDFEKAMNCCEKVLKNEPRNKQALYNNGLSLLKLGKNSKAIELFEKLITYYPDFKLAKNKLGFLLYKTEEFNKALKIFENLLEKDPNDCVALNNKGNCFHSLNRDEDALICYEQVLKIDSNYKIAWYNKGLSLYNLGQFQKALLCYDKSLNIDPDYIDALINKGNTNCSLHKYGLGIKDYNKALEIKPENTRALYNKGKALIILEKFEDALKCFNQFLSSDQNDKTVWFETGTLNHRLNRKDVALECFEEVVKLDPQNTKAMNNIGIIYAELNNYKKAIQQYDKALNIEPNSKGVLYNKSLVLEKLERFTEAIENLEKALIIDPNYKEAWFNKGVLLGIIENYNDSIKCFEEVLRIDPNDTLVLNNKAINYLKSGQYDEADSLFREAYRLDKDEGNFNYNQSCIACLKNETQKALNLLKLAIYGDEKYKKIAKDDKDFTNIKHLDEFQDLVND